MNSTLFSRRRFLIGALLAAPIAVWADARLIEPNDLAVRRPRIGSSPGRHRLVHFSDLHHKGDTGYLRSVVAQINALKPDFICFTGDLVEKKEFLPEALAVLSGLQAPLYGVPGNHDFLSEVSFATLREFFAGTGGAWLQDEHRLAANGQLNLIGTTCHCGQAAGLPLQAGAKNILLMHYPAHVKRLGDQKFDLILAGHSHGGQVRLPVVGALKLPSRVDEYDLGLFNTPAGPLYVNAGIGYIGDNDFRFNCRPEISVFEI